MTSPRAIRPVVVGLVAAATLTLGVALAPVAGASPAGATGATGVAASAAGASGVAAPAAGSAGSGSLRSLVAGLPVAAENRTGYDRSLFKLWIDADHDGCDTRDEVLLAEAVTAPTIGSSCTLSGGSWYSYYDEATWTATSDLDIDHLVPLAEVWDSGGYAWSAQHRQDYANDLSDDRTLVAVTDNVNQSKGDRDPAEWMPSAASATCTYVDSWVAVKSRWDLSVDSAEASALSGYAANCPNVTISWNAPPAS